MRDMNRTNQIQVVVTIKLQRELARHISFDLLSLEHISTRGPQLGVNLQAEFDHVHEVFGVR